MKMILIKRIGYLGLSSILLFSCGGSGGSGNQSEISANTEISSPAEAEAVVSASLDFVKESLGIKRAITDISKSNISSFSLDKNHNGWLGYVLNLYSSFGADSIRTQQVETEDCFAGGTVSANINYGNNSANGSITFNNCIIEYDNTLTTLNGSLSITAVDNNGNNYPERVSINFKKGFSVSNRYVSFYVDNNLSYIVDGNGDDIIIENNDINLNFIIDGGPVKIKDKEDDKEYIVSSKNLNIYLKTNGTWYTFSINGGISYKDNYCIKNGLSINLKTIENFEGYINYCEYKGKLSINNESVIVESYDMDNDPYNNNYLKIIYKGETIYDNLCENFNPPEICE